MIDYFLLDDDNNIEIVSFIISYDDYSLVGIILLNNIPNVK